jgi:uncharacterized membrane protein YkoI
MTARYGGSTAEGWSVANTQGEENDMGKLQHGVIALTVGATSLSGGALGASAQEVEGPHGIESPVAAGTLDDGANLLSQAGIPMDAAIEAAQGAATGAVGEVDLEYAGDVLVFNVDIGAHDVKVDARSGAVLSVDAEE